MEKVQVKLPQGKIIEVASGQKIQEVASSQGVNSNVIAAKLDGVAVDLDRALSRD